MHHGGKHTGPGEEVGRVVGHGTALPLPLSNLCLNHEVPAAPHCLDVCEGVNHSLPPCPLKFHVDGKVGTCATNPSAGVGRREISTDYPVPHSTAVFIASKYTRSTY